MIMTPQRNAALGRLEYDMTNGEPTRTGPSKLTDYVVMLHEYYAAYHHHKEAMAYAGFSLYAAAVVTGLVGGKWPPKGETAWSIIGILLTWCAVLTYLKFQLHRRRWAAIRRAGCERLLARWVIEEPKPEDWALAPVSELKVISRWKRISDLAWPNDDAVRIIETDQQVYPAALMHEWKARELKGSHAILHERLIVVTGWLLTLAIIARTVV